MIRARAVKPSLRANLGPVTHGTPVHGVLDLVGEREQDGNTRGAAHRTGPMAQGLFLTRVTLEPLHASLTLVPSTLRNDSMTPAFRA